MGTDKVDKFGKFLVDNLRDKGIIYAEGLLNNKWKAPVLQNIQLGLTNLGSSEKEVVKDAIIATLDSAIHDFLFALQEQTDFENGIKILVDGENVIELSDGIHGEPYSDEGWYSKYSKFKSIE
jgi:hypothetical protein